MIFKSVNRILFGILEWLINSNIYISLAAVFLTLESQLQLGIKPQWHPYLFLIFFATLFEYNLHRLVTVLLVRESLDSLKHVWVKKHLVLFYIVVLFSIVGFIITLLFAKIQVLLTLAPLALLTVFYSTPLLSNNNRLFRLRQIPYLKIFLIAFVWSTVTVLLPVIQMNLRWSTTQVVLMILERFLFLFAITVPFDIRDIEPDSEEKLKTIPLVLGIQRSWFISYFALLFFLAISIYHYTKSGQSYMVWVASLSFLTTFVFLKNKKIRNLPFYHYGILDGTLILQGILSLIFYYFSFKF